MLFYGNTLFNQYALDDAVVLTQNTQVQKGISAIPSFFQSDYTQGFGNASSALTTSRFRPLTLSFFALQYQFFGLNPFAGHFINLLLFSLLITLLFSFLSDFLKAYQLFAHPDSFLSNHLAHITCLFFIAHPIHAEVVANIKSVDEILVFTFIILSLRYAKLPILKTQQLISISTLFSAFFFFLALLVKESAIIVLPLLFVFDITIEKTSIFNYFKSYFLHLLLLLTYIFLHYWAVGWQSHTINDVTNSPFIWASPAQAFATKVWIIVLYFQHFFWPLYLSSDYGFNQIPYISILSWQFILSAIFLISLAAIAIRSYQKQRLSYLLIAWFFIALFPYANFMFDVGAPMADRFLFQPSLALCLFLAYLFCQFNIKIGPKSYWMFFPVLICLFLLTFNRNKVWKDNRTLILHDVQQAPNSARLNLFASEQELLLAKAYEGQSPSPAQTPFQTESHIQTQTQTQNQNQTLSTAITQSRIHFQSALHYAQKADSIQPNFAPNLERLGLAYFYTGNYYAAAHQFIRAKQLGITDPNFPSICNQLSVIFRNHARANQNKLTDIAIADSLIY